MTSKKAKILHITKLTILIMLALIISSLIFLFSYTGGNEPGLVKSEKIINNGLTPFTDDFGYPSFVMAENTDFKILQLTDTHFGNGFLSVNQDIKALNAVKKLVEFTIPDLIIITGDVVYPVPIQSGSRNNLKALKAFGTFMEGFEIPWTMVFGNHDCEEYATNSKIDLCEYLESLEFCIFQTLDLGKNRLSNGLINIYNNNNTLNTSLFLFDSGTAINNIQLLGYEHITQEQTNWYENEILRLSEDGSIIPSLAFMHIPQLEYKKAWNAYLKNSEEVEYHYGGVNEGGGKISCAAEQSSLFDKMLELGSTKGIFVGHDHLNDYSVTYRGIRLTFGKSIDYLAYIGISNQTNQRGATMITIDENSSFECIPIRLTDIS